MRKICKKLIAVFCVLLLVSGSIVTTNVVRADAETVTNVIFREDFNSYNSADATVNKEAMLAKGWNADDTTVKYNTGSTYSIPHNVNANLVLSNLQEAATWTDYIVEAQLKFEATPTTAGKTVAGIAGRVQDASGVKKGYDIIVYKTKLDTETNTGAQLRLRCDGSPLATATIDSLPANTTFTLKLEFQGTVIKGYLNGEEKISHDTVNDATKYASGYAGIRRQDRTGYTATFDDFTVSVTTEVTPPAGTQINTLFSDNFNDYSSADASINKEAMIAKGWNADNTTVKYTTGSTYSIPHNVNANLVLSNLQEAATWTDYIVEAQLKFEATPTTAGKTVAGIAGRVQDASGVKKGYDIIVYKTKLDTETNTGAQLRLRCDGSPLATATIDSLPVNTTFTLKLEFQGTVIKGYLNGEEKISHDTVNDATKYASGYAGIRRQDRTGYTTTFDDFKVYTVTQVAPPGSESNTLFSDDFNDYGSADIAVNKAAMLAKGWNADDTTVKYNTGSAYSIPHNVNANLVLSNLQEAAAWTDYIVEAKMKFEATPTTAGKTVAGIAGRVQDASGVKKGYDLIVYKTKLDTETNTGAQLRLRCDGAPLATASVDSLPVNTEFTLKLKFDGTVIKGYMDGNLMMTYDTANDATKYASGYAGIRRQDRTGYTTVFDDFKVYTPTEVIPPADTTSKELFFDDFESYSVTDATGNQTAMIEKGWNATSATAAYNTGSAYSIPHNVNANLVLSNLEGATKWTDYVVEAKMKFETEPTTVGKTVAGIAGRVQDASGVKKGYDLIVYKAKLDTETNTSAQLRLRCNGVGLAAATIESIPAGTEFLLELEFKGTVIKGYFDGKLMITYDTANDATKYASGYAGIRRQDLTGYPTTFDDFKVCALLDMELPKGHYYYNDFAGEATLEEEGWGSSEAITKENKALLLKAGNTAYLSGVTRSTRWMDYIVEADAKLVSSTATTGAAGLIVRADETANTGYEFKMVYDNGTTSVVLVERGETDVVLGTYYIPFELDTSYKMTVAVCGNSLMCWFDNTLVFDYIDPENAYLMGYTGVCSSSNTTGMNSIYDNYAVREYVEPETVYPEGYYYFNAFESSKELTKEGWRVNGNKKDGAYVLSGTSFNYLTNIEGSSEWTDYVVEADVMLNDDGTVPQYASIVARSNNLIYNGYEYRIVKDDKGTWLWLYKRGAEGGKINGNTYKFQISVTPGEYNHMKLVLNGAEIICYFNGIRFFHIVDENPYLNGYIGLRSPAGTATQSYDNLGVRKVLKTDLAEKSVLKKGKGNIWFHDDFTGESALTDRGWNTDNMDIHDGAVKVYKRFYVNGIEGSEKWTDYEVSAVIKVDKQAGLMEGAVGGWGAICARSLSDATGYEFGIATPASSTAFLRLYDRAELKTTDDKSFVITEGEHLLRMKCIGNEISCYYDDELVFVVQSDSSKAGYAGLRASGYNTYYKEFTVRKASLTNQVIPGGTTVSPQTGDSLGNVVNVAKVLFMVSAVGLIATIVYKRKIEEETNYEKR